MSKCPTCPIVGPCVAETPGHAFACKLAVGSEAERRWVAEASQGVQPTPSKPSLLKQAASLGKAAVTFVASGCATVDRAEFERRHGICEACPNFDAAQDRCNLCGCLTQVKLWGEAMHCPDDPPRW